MATTAMPSLTAAAGLLLALLAAVLHAAYILLRRGGWDQAGDAAATFLIVVTAALGLGALAAATRSATVLAPVTDLGLTGLLLLEGALAGTNPSCWAPRYWWARHRRPGRAHHPVRSCRSGPGGPHWHRPGCQPPAAAKRPTASGTARPRPPR
jgi:hypothetical protein